jgi:DNA-binding PadR family transcriptional regulator
MLQYNGFSSISQLGQKFRYNVPMPKAKQSKKTSAHHPCMGGTLDKLVQPAVLAILAKGPLHCYELARQVSELQQFADTPPDISGVYRTLKTLENRGLVTSDWDNTHGGHSRRLFTITDRGRHSLANWHAALQNYHKAIGLLLKTTKKAIALCPE